MTRKAKDIEFMGTSLDDIRGFPEPARQRAGQNLRLVQDGHMPDDFKWMPDVGEGALEIRIRLTDATYRLFYVAKFGDVVYVLHAFNKKSRTGAATDGKDIEKGRKYYKEARADYDRHQYAKTKGRGRNDGRKGQSRG